MTRLVAAGCEVVRLLDLPIGTSPVVGDDEFSWEFPAKPGHWAVLKEPDDEATRTLLESINDFTTPEELKDIMQDFFNKMTRISQ